MKLPLLALAGLTVLAAIPASAPAVAEEPQVNRWVDPGAQSRVERPSYGERCFNGRFITGVNRMGDKTLFVQSRSGPIYQVSLSGACPALAGAQRIVLRTSGDDVVCTGDTADVFAYTSGGSSRCATGEVRRLSATEVSALSQAAHR